MKGMPLAKLLDNFEEPASRRQRATIIVQAGGKLIMPSEHYDFSGAQSITNAIQQLPPERAELRAALEELHQNAKPVLIELTKTQPQEAEKAAKRLEQFVEAAKEEKPDKDFLQVTSKGLIDAEDSGGDGRSDHRDRGQAASAARFLS